MGAINLFCLAATCLLGLAVAAAGRNLCLGEVPVRGVPTLFITVLSMMASLILVGVSELPRGPMAGVGLVVISSGIYLLIEADKSRRGTHGTGLGPGTTRDPHFSAVGIPFLLGSLVALGAVAMQVLAPQESSANVVPPMGTVVSAQTGEVVTHYQKSTPLDAEVGVGRDFRACDRTTEHPCRWSPEGPPIRVHKGDLIEFGVLLNNGGDSVVPYARLTVEHGLGGVDSEGHESISARLDLQYRSGVSKGAHGEVTLEPAGDHGGFTDLTYVPGSTVLRTRKHALLARLPDGIMENGIALANIGSPASCYYCDIRYIRLVFFSARVHQGR